MKTNWEVMRVNEDIASFLNSALEVNGYSIIVSQEWTPEVSQMSDL